MAPAARRRRSGRSPLTVGLIALAIVLVAVFLGFTKDIPFTHGFRLNAVFESSNGLRVNSPVRIAGVEVGKGISTSRDGNATTVTFTVDETGRPIHTDAFVAVRPRIFLEGNFFIDLDPGSPSAPDMDSGAEVYAEVLARALEVPATRQRLAERIAPLLGSAQALGLPAILGVHRPDQVHRELQSLLGVPVFEIPTMPPAVPGVRLRELFETQLPQPTSIQRLGGFFPHRSLPVRFHRGMLFEWRGLPTYAGRNSTDQCCFVFYCSVHIHIFASNLSP